MSKGYPTRVRVNIGAVQTGKNRVMTLYQTIGDKVNEAIDKTKEDKTGGGQYDCFATVEVGQDIYKGQYNSATAIHAEMDALRDYLSDPTNKIEDIDKIDISAPPCKACGVVFYLLGVESKVVCPGGVYKEFTSSWKWPEVLKNSAHFNQERWAVVKGYFANSCLDEKSIIDNIAHIIESKSSN